VPPETSAGTVFSRRFFRYPLGTSESARGMSDNNNDVRTGKKKLKIFSTNGRINKRRPLCVAAAVVEKRPIARVFARAFFFSLLRNIRASPGLGCS